MIQSKSLPRTATRMHIVCIITRSAWLLHVRSDANVEVFKPLRNHSIRRERCYGCPLSQLTPWSTFQFAISHFGLRSSFQAPHVLSLQPLGPYACGSHRKANASPISARRQKRYTSVVVLSRLSWVGQLISIVLLDCSRSAPLESAVVVIGSSRECRRLSVPQLQWMSVLNLVHRCRNCVFLARVREHLHNSL